MFQKLKENSNENNQQERSFPSPFGGAEKPAANNQLSPNNTPASKIETGNRLSKDVSIKGKIQLNGDISIDGKIEGEITTAGTITFKENAQIEAKVEAGSVIIHGNLKGDITAKNNVNILKTAKITGDIKAATLSIESGAIFSGQFNIGQPAQPEKPSSQKATETPTKENKNLNTKNSPIKGNMKKN